MKSRKLLKTFLAITMCVLGLGSMLALPTFAEANPCDPDLPEAVREANGCTHTSSDAFESTLTGILNGIIGASSLVAVIFILIGGINYMTSAGDAGKVAKAKSTILYATIGLAVCVLAFAIVNWAIGAIAG